MSLEEIINQGGTLIYDPTMSTMTPDELLSTYGEIVNTIGIIAKSEVGSSYFQSSTAPKDPRYGEMFSSFAQIASDIGIEVYALLHGNVDGFISRDPNFKMYKSGGSPVETFVCPNQENYWFYLSEIAGDIAKNIPVSGLILTDILYPRENTCFCDNCKRQFSQDKNIDRDFSYEFLKNKEGLMNEFHKMRLKAIRKMISSVVNRVHQEKKLEIITEMLIDPQTNYFKGAMEHFGQDLTTFSQVSPHIMLHFYPWSPFPSEEEEIDRLIANMEPIMDRLTNIRTSLFNWELSSDHLPLALKLKESLRAEYLFFTEQQPRSYLDRRTLHLDLSM